MVNGMAWIDDVFRITFTCENIETLIHSEAAPVIYWRKKEKYFSLMLEGPTPTGDAKVNMVLFEALPLGEELVLQWGDAEMPVYPGAIVRTDWFEHNYTDIHAKLGADYSRNQTAFSVWAPTATVVTLWLKGNRHPLIRSNAGVWETVVKGDWDGAAYQYEVTVNGKTTIVNDPYAKAMLANSEKSVVMNMKAAEPKNFQTTKRPPIKQLQDAIIYELHVRDATIMHDSGVRHKGKFLGLTEKNTTTSKGFSTGLSYIKDLGVTHVQLMPINDFARVDELNPNNGYNWGYDPLYFQVPEGSYATRVDIPEARVKECKQMIQAFHEEGIAVIFDVVYNHVFYMPTSPFEQLVPGYYFRYDDNGHVSNGTGVGNDFASERIMARKFIIDSIDFWLDEYKVDGFRFDLMGALDIDTMTEIRTRCEQEEIPVMLLGEGWTLPTAINPDRLATSVHSGQLKGVRFFNDFFRDSLKGSLFNTNDQGFANGRGQFIERLPHLVSGSALEKFGQPFVADVTQTVNYVECHDNHTLWDRLELTNSRNTETVRRKMHQLATGVTLLSQGVPFLHAGQEWFRTKAGDENSYRSGDHINQLDWHEREKQQDNISYVKKLIALRKQYPVFRLVSKQEINRRLHILTTPAPVFGFTLLGDARNFSIYVNPDEATYQVLLPSNGRWQTLVTNNKEKETQYIEGEVTTIGPYELIVLMRQVKIV